MQRTMTKTKVLDGNRTAAEIRHEIALQVADFKSNGQKKVPHLAAVLVGTDGDTIVASAMVGFDGHRGWVYYVAVSPEHQGMGLGQTMMHAAEEWLRGRGVGKLQLMIRGENHAVPSFYRRLGNATEDVTVMSIRL